MAALVPLGDSAVGIGLEPNDASSERGHTLGK
jgi:hypothetical protein